ncbi:predicted protein [Uncinocarpus reesii 1704]|uniref:Uncharacterized protein n=1 Tax=Uncinocarpus reesii (strain UAMH 1704) TaxID=336963 RepID=C4JUP9_UNCRE|nr:uncharacterized protein UREG_04852 [Uncinocarpus reesii 1704]EEP80010.1 predicted protein [Uncinocarpus reesii 1704]
MDSYRIAARNWLESADIDDTFHDDFEVIQGVSFRALLGDIEANEKPTTDLDICENILVVQMVVKSVEPEKALVEDERRAADGLISWVSSAILPLAEFEGIWEKVQLATGTSDFSRLISRRIYAEFPIDATREQLLGFKNARIKATLGLTLLKELYRFIPIDETTDPPHSVAVLAAFTDPSDPWTTPTAASAANFLLKPYGRLCQTKSTLFEDVLTRFVKSSFLKTKTPAITSAGRKDVHPVKQPKFDPGLFDKSSKPWKHKDVFVVTILSWTIGQYTPYQPRLCLRGGPHTMSLVPSYINPRGSVNSPSKVRIPSFILRHSNEISRFSSLKEILQPSAIPAYKRRARVPIAKRHSDTSFAP